MNISIEEKLGSLLLIGFKGSELEADHPIIENIKKYNLGGVILFDKLLAQKSNINNIISPKQVLRLTTQLKDTSENLLIAVDQEGGFVNRFKADFGFPTTEPVYDLALDSSLSKTEQAASQTAQMLSDCGVNFNLAPVADLNINSQNPIIGKYKRSFSDSPLVVIDHAEIWIKEHKKRNILSCLKHFPGHGSSQDDSHNGFVDISDTWDSQELIPYQELNQRQSIDAVMTGHLFNKKHDDQYPATLSKSSISELLRKQVGYQGPLLSDDMQMGAITKHYGFADACVKAIEAGVDLLVIGNNLIFAPDIVPKLINSFKQALDSGTLSEVRINEAWARVQTLKNKIM